MKGLYFCIRGYVELCKPTISLFAALSASMGLILSLHNTGPGMFSLTCGVFLLACGASALNQYQDRQTDAIMPRTAGRPLPSGRIRPETALKFGLGLIFCGSLLFILSGEKTVFLLGLFAVSWYNGVYAFLKRRTAFSVVPGALVGAVPPAMGWVSGGGALLDHSLIAVCFFFFMWQAPHFWLLLIDRADEYKKAGLPSPAALFNKSQLRRIVFIWMSSAAVSVLIIPMVGGIKSPGIAVFLFGASLWLVYNGVRVLMQGKGGAGCILAFRRINAFVLIVMLLLSLDKLISGLNV